MNFIKHNKTLTAIIIVAIWIVICTTYLVLCVEPKPKTVEAPQYTVYVYDNGEAQIDVSKFNAVTQTHENLIINNKLYKAGTLIVPGDGNIKYYDYPQRDVIRKTNE